MLFPVIYLGISQDRYDSGVAVVCDGRIAYAANEERFTRRKCQGGFPYRALAAAFACTGLRDQDIDRIAVAGHNTPPLPLRMMPELHRVFFADDRTGAHPWREWLVDYLGHHTSIAAGNPLLQGLGDRLREPALRRTLPAGLRRLPLEFVDHHTAHAAGARALSGFDPALCLTADGFGDGVSLTVSRWQGRTNERIASVPLHHSLGIFYEDLTQALGFIPNRHEGKVTGLAAQGDWSAVDVPSPFTFADGQPRYRGPRGRAAVEWFRQQLCRRFRREDIASWAQHILEENIVAVARYWLAQTGPSRLALAGGVFANVRLNQRLHQLPQVEAIFIHPNMGDGGQALGAIAAAGGVAIEPLTDVFVGDGFDERDISAALGAAGVANERCADIDRRAAELVAAGRLVARFTGRMEWGPRALGNRSVLARADDRNIVQRLNQRLRRSDFMPFAPAVTAEDADLYFDDLDGARHAAEFMTLCFDATPRMRETHPAVVHVDGSARAQLVQRQTNPSFHRLLLAYQRSTGHPLLLNTSFNIHEEPIVRTPAEAIRAFRQAGLDHLVLGEHLVSAAHLGQGQESSAAAGVEA
ncbi:MAG TPA: carbamoyltransferase C-terminal domain-containing protein [Terriglobales bacterium]|nr:carbamoyltransferase C-terminal domain-containing protein [Terriglobales bacterium]